MTDELWLVISIIIAFSIGFYAGTRFAYMKTLKMLDELHTMLKEVK